LEDRDENVGSYWKIYEKLYPGICLTTDEEAWKNLSQDSRRVPVGTMKIKYTQQNIHNNKNT